MKRKPTSPNPSKGGELAESSDYAKIMKAGNNFQVISLLIFKTISLSKELEKI